MINIDKTIDRLTPTVIIVCCLYLLGQLIRVIVQ
jgi:hypothetical protein